MAKRIASSSVNWDFLNKSVLPDSVPFLMQLKNKSDKYLRQLSDLPAELPKIDWSFYKSKITKPGMLDTFQKNYESLQIPYPGDNGLIAEVEKDEHKFKAMYKEDVGKTQKYLEEKEKELKKLSSMKKISEMTMDEYMHTYPNSIPFYTEMFPVSLPSVDKKTDH